MAVKVVFRVGTLVFRGASGHVIAEVQSCPERFHETCRSKPELHGFMVVKVSTISTEQPKTFRARFRLGARPSEVYGLILAECEGSPERSCRSRVSS